MMKSFLSKNTIIRFLSGKMPYEEEQKFLDQEPVVNRMEQQWNDQKEDIGDFEQQKVWKKITARIYPNPRKGKVRTMMIRISAAACIILLAGLGYYRYQMGKDSTSQLKFIIAETSYEERRQVILPDSSIVWLNAGSRIEYPEEFLTGTRQVRLSGEAYFDVKQNKKQPFTVTTEKLQVHVLGTQFVVSDYSEDTMTETVLVDGKVAVNINKDSSGRLFELSPDESLTFDETKHSTNIRKINALQHCQWITGRLYFDNVELGDIIKQLERWYGKKVSCPENLGKYYRLTLTISDESWETIIQLMQSAAPIKFRKTGNNSFKIYGSNN
ncbi:MAG: FecR domain-containing protein [Bacteroidales bacterium]|jgi:ferric-dicitrate binding protein FerR (iron transport regulator)|nr:FecR domain-containing protein [Bacteroidales bacterium]